MIAAMADVWSLLLLATSLRKYCDTALCNTEVSLERLAARWDLSREMGSVTGNRATRRAIPGRCLAHLRLADGQVPGTLTGNAGRRVATFPHEPASAGQ